MTTRDDQLGTRRFALKLPIGWATAATTGDVIVLRAPIRMQLTAVRFLADVAITGHADNNATVSVINKGAAGAGTTEMASKAFDTPTTDDVAQYDESAITLSGTAANLVAAAGDLISVKKAVAGDGLAVAGTIVIEATPAGS